MTGTKHVARQSRFASVRCFSPSGNLVPHTNFRASCANVEPNLRRVQSGDLRRGLISSRNDSRRTAFSAVEGVCLNQSFGRHPCVLGTENLCA